MLRSLSGDFGSSSTAMFVKFCTVEMDGVKNLTNGVIEHPDSTDRHIRVFSFSVVSACKNNPLGSLMIL